MRTNKLFTKLLKNEKLKMTKTRVAILSLLSLHKRPFDVVAIETHLTEKKFSTDRVTIYRTLDTFVKKRIISKHEFQEGKFRYEMADKDHYHVVCDDCGLVNEVSNCPVDYVEKELERKLAFKMRSHSLVFYGLCRACQ